MLVILKIRRADGEKIEMMPLERGVAFAIAADQIAGGARSVTIKPLKVENNG